MFKNKKQKKRRISKAVADAMVSGDDWLESVQILQALDPVEDLLQSQIDGLDKILKDYGDAGGRIFTEEREDGYDIISSWNDVEWRLVFDSEGNKCDMIVRDSTPKQTDPETIGSVKRALQAAYEIPRRQYALTELEKIVSYVENNNALSGLDRVRDLLSDDKNIVYSTATAASGEVDMSPLVESK